MGGGVMGWQESRIYKDEVTFDSKDMDAQAEASFKAGQQAGRQEMVEMVKWLQSHPSSISILE